MEMIGPLLAELAAALAEEPRFGPGVELAAVGAGRGFDTDLTRVVARGARGEMRLWVKRYRTQRTHARKEWLYLRERAPHGGYDLVEPIAYLERAEAVVTRHVEGELLTRRFAGPSAATAVERDCAAIGAWLAAFHRPMEGAAAHPREAIVGDVAARARRAAGGHMAAAVVARAEALLAGAADADLVRVRTHGDFAPFNVLVGECGGAVLDPSFEASVERLGNRCARYEDVARFVVAIEREAALRGGAARAAVDAFVGGYRSVAGVRLHAGALAAFMLKYGLQALVDGWWHAGPGGVEARVDGYVALAEALARG